MFFPLGTDRLPRHRPTTTIVLVVLNLLVFVGVAMAVRAGSTTHEEIIRWGSVSREHFHWWSLVSSTFLHDPTGLGHVGFNMLFLWVFGQAVETRLGSWWFALFYLAGGIASGLAHMVTTPVPAIGASGAVAAVSGAYLALFPRSTVRVLLFFFLIGIYHVPALWFIAFYVAIDIFSQASAMLGRENGVANAAHLGGYAFGFSTAILLLAIGILPRTDLDMLYLFKQWRRRREMRAVAREYGSGFDGPKAGGPIPRRVDVAPPSTPDPDAPARRSLQEALRGEDDEKLGRLYRDTAATVVLPDANQADLGNRLLSSGQVELAARAYRDLLSKRGERATGPGGPTEDFRLLLSSLLIRHLDRIPEAVPELEALSNRRLAPASAELLRALRTEAGLAPSPESAP